MKTQLEKRVKKRPFSFLKLGGGDRYVDLYIILIIPEPKCRRK